MHRIVACIVVMGMATGIGNRAFAQEADPAHADYRRAAHKAANQAVGALIESGRWNAETGGPGLAMAGGGKCVVCPCISVSTGYDGVADMGSDFLNDSDEIHLARQYIFDDEEVDIPGFVRRNPVNRAFFVRDSAGRSLVQFQENGDILIHKGEFDSGITSFTESPSVSEFFVKKHDGTIAAEIDETTGSFLIRGTWTPYDDTTAVTASKEFAVRSAGDAGSAAQVVLKDDGSLRLRGYIFTKDGPVAAP